MYFNIAIRGSLSLIQLFLKNTSYDSRNGLTIDTHTHTQTHTQNDIHILYINTHSHVYIRKVNGN